MSFYEQVDQVFATWNYNSPRILHSFIRALKPHHIVDCGTYRGLSASWMAKACQENNFGRVVALDNWSLLEHAHILGDKTPKQHAEDNLTRLGVREWVEFHDGDEFDDSVWPSKVDFIYIDAWHSFSACQNDTIKAIERGASFLAYDDTENCVGPRMFVDSFNQLVPNGQEWQQLDLHSDNGLTIFVKKQPRRKITFSQELPYPNPGVDLRPLSLAEQQAHFDEASKITGINYSSILNLTEHDLTV